MPKGNDREILYVAESSDGKGPRVLVREAEVENCMWPGDVIQDVDRRLLGITSEEKEEIERFLKILNVSVV